MYIPWRRSNHCIVNGEELQQDGVLGEGDGVGVVDEDGGGGSHPAGARDGFKGDSTLTYLWTRGLEGDQRTGEDWGAGGGKFGFIAKTSKKPRIRWKSFEAA